MDYTLPIDILGWIGSAEVIAAFALNSFQKIRSDSKTFQWLNLTGGVFLIIYTIHHGAYASAVINIVWVVIAVGAILQALFKK